MQGTTEQQTVAVEDKRAIFVAWQPVVLPTCLSALQEIKQKIPPPPPAWFPILSSVMMELQPIIHHYQDVSDDQ